MPTDWQRVAAERLREIHRLRAALGRDAHEIADVTRRRVETWIHIHHLASLDSDSVRGLLVDLQLDIVAQLGGTDADANPADPLRIAERLIAEFEAGQRRTDGSMAIDPTRERWYIADAYRLAKSVCRQPPTADRPTPGDRSGALPIKDLRAAYADVRMEDFPATTDLGRDNQARHDARLRAVEALVRERIDARRCCECNEPIAPNDWDRRTIALRAAEEIQRAHEDGIDDDPESMAFLLSIIAGAIDQDAANLQSEIDRLREIEALWRDMFPFFEWAQSYLDSSRWAGCKLYDGIKAEMLERDAEIDRLRGEVAELREGLRRFRRWEAADNAS